VHVVGARVVGLECFPTPGHASHHVSYLDHDGTLYAGDAAGVRIQPDRFVLPPTPPPDFDLETWLQTVEEIERRAPERLALIHFGVADDVARHLGELRKRLVAWSERVATGMTEDEFAHSVREELSADGETDAEFYERAMPFWQSYAGLVRYHQRVS
jgi:glyoxylase-like metal-dependent hydrolase (beta-lactamase superfamily II)